MLKIILITLILIMILSTPVFGYNIINGELDPWTKEQKNMQLSLTILAILNYGTTNYALQHPEMGYYESEPGIYGHPTPQQMLEYGLKLYAEHLVVSYLLPSNYRDNWLKFGIGYQIYCVNNNFSIGCQLQF